ncbi:FMN-binding protein, partial [Priestia megaterium]
KDGTYSGQGSNRIGTVYVSVTIKNDRIDTVEITEADTHYSESYIEGLPSQVVQRQSSDVDVVSGATLSTEDFQNAVDDALQQAMNA